MTKRILLTDAEKRMYSSEKLMNFRLVSRILGKKSPYVLTSRDIAPASDQAQISELGQFAELAYVGSGAISFIFDGEHTDTLLSEAYPLFHYNALKGAILVKHLIGSSANVGSFVVYQPDKCQLLVAICGTSNTLQAIYDLHATKHHPRSYPEGCLVHAGFWHMYKGLRAQLLDLLRASFNQYTCAELAIVGHSMGGALAYFLSLDLLDPVQFESKTLPKISLAVFGAPRCGNLPCVEYWRELVTKHRASFGKDAFKEYSVKAYKDGVPSLPLLEMGYRHFSQNPFYTKHGILYRTPLDQSEFTAFRVDVDSSEVQLIHPRGGHNYYNARDMELMVRSVTYLEKLVKLPDWQDQYLSRAAKKKWYSSVSEPVSGASSQT